MRTRPEEVRRIACVGTGTIGGGWVAHYLARGKDVVATDLAPDAERLLRAQVDRAWPVLERIGLAAGASRSRLGFTADLGEAVRDQDFVQESVPDREELKARVIAAIGEHAPADAIIA